MEHYFEKWVCLQDKIHIRIHDWVYFDYTEQHGKLWFEFLYSYIYEPTFHIHRIAQNKRKHQVCMKTCSSLVKMFSDGEHNVMQNISN